VLVASCFFFTDCQNLTVRISHADCRADRIQVVAAGRRRATTDRLISSGFSILPAGIDIAARKRRIRALIVLESIGELLGAGRDVNNGGLDLVSDPVVVQDFRVSVSMATSLRGCGGAVSFVCRQFYRRDETAPS